MSGFDYFKKFLQDEGFRFNNEESFISFKFQGTSFVAFKNDSSFLQIVLICNAKGKSRSSLLEICNKMNDDRFVVKFVAQEDSVWCSYEFEPSEHTTSDDFSMALTLLDKSSDELLKSLNS